MTAATTAATRPSSNGAGAPPRAALELTLAPIGAEAFTAEHWERRPLVVPRAERGRFDGVLSREAVERLVCTTGIRAPAFRLVRDGEPLPQSAYAETIPWRPRGFTESAIVSRVAEEFEQGATIVLQGLHHHWQPAALYCRELAAALGCRVQANAYYTPASAQGFDVHHDTHDVFVLQLAGSKRWRVYEPLLELPLGEQRWSPALGDPGGPVADFVLEEGDTLYMPRGWPHEAFTSEADSLHLTVGLHPYTRFDAVRAALEECAGDIEFRRNVGPDGVVPDRLLERLAEAMEPDQVSRRMRRNLIARARPILDGQLEQVRGLGGLGVDDELERRPTVMADLDLTEDDVTLLFDGKEIRFPGQAREAVAALFAADGPITASSLPGRLDEAGRLVLVRRLVREGFLRRV